MIHDISTSMNSLNKEQKEAVLLDSGPFLVLAGAGSGKTRVLTQRIIDLIGRRHIEPFNILAVTFTNKAANEMKNRVQQHIEAEQSKSIWIGTFHGICNRLLRQEITSAHPSYTRNFVILDASESQAMIKDCIRTLNIDEKLYTPKKLQYAISGLKSQCLEPPDFEKQVHDVYTQRVLEVYRAYQDKLAISNSLDFDDLLLLSLKLLKNNPDKRNYYHSRFKHILVDEFQDTNKVQYDFLKLLCTPANSSSIQWDDRSFCTVGDIDQSIYSWRGADYKLALNFQKDFPQAKVIKLENNYRSSQHILNAANSVIQNNKQRIEKNLICTKGNGKKITKLEAGDEIEESLFITKEIQKLKKDLSYNQMAVLYRTNAQSRVIEESLVRAKIPYKLIGGVKFYDRLEIKDILGYLRLIYNSHDTIALKRIINTPKRGIGASTIKQIEEQASKSHCSLFGALEDLLDSEDLSPRVTQSIHEFAGLINHLKTASKELEIPDLIRLILDKTSYLQILKDQNTDEADARIDNIHELINVAEEFMDTSEEVSLEAFLTQIALVGESDNLVDSDNSVTLMTIHASKGLEFPCVFISGLEEGIFPHVRALQTSRADDIEEERRLLYVAITRAEDLLYITHARYRRLWGTREFAEASRFLIEIPTDCISNYFDNSSQSPRTPQPVQQTTSQPRREPTPEVQLFLEGDIVQHRSFGVGVVVSILGSKNRKFYTVSFDNQEFGKKLLAGESLKKLK